MADDWLLVIHLLYEPGQKPVAENALDWLLERGCQTQEGGGTEMCHYYSTAMDWPRSGMPTEQALSELKDREGYLRLWLDGVQFDFQNWETYDEVSDLPYYTFKVPKAQLAPVESIESGRQRANTVLELVANFADETRAFYGFGDQAEATGEHESDQQDVDALRRGELNRVFWFNYFSEPIVSQLGRERLLEAPAERVEERPTKAILLVPYVNPKHRESGHHPRQVEEHFGI